MIDYGKCGATFRSDKSSDGFGRPSYEYGVILKTTENTVIFRLECTAKNSRLNRKAFAERYEWQNEDYVSIHADHKSIIEKYGDTGLNKEWVEQMLNSNPVDCMFFDAGQRNAWYDAMDALEVANA